MLLRVDFAADCAESLTIEMFRYGHLLLRFEVRELSFVKLAEPGRR
jgi:hypothetical protein